MSTSQTIKEQIKVQSNTFFKILQDESKELVLLQYWKGLEKLIANYPTEVSEEQAKTLFTTIQNSKKVLGLPNLLRAIIISMRQVEEFPRLFLSWVHELTVDYFNNAEILDNHLLVILRDTEQLLALKKQYATILGILIHNNVDLVICLFEPEFILEHFREDKKLVKSFIFRLINLKMFEIAFEITSRLPENQAFKYKPWLYIDFKLLNISEQRNLDRYLEKLELNCSFNVLSRQLWNKRVSLLLNSDKVALNSKVSQKHNDIFEILLKRTDSSNSSELQFLNEILEDQIGATKREIIKFVLFLKGKAPSEQSKQLEISQGGGIPSISFYSSTFSNFVNLVESYCFPTNFSVNTYNFKVIVSAFSSLKLTKITTIANELTHYILLVNFIFFPSLQETLVLLIDNLTDLATEQFILNIIYPILLHFFTSIYIKEANNSQLVVAFLKQFAQLSAIDDSVLTVFNKLVPVVYSRLADKEAILDLITSFTLQKKTGKQTDLFLKLASKNISSKDNVKLSMNAISTYLQKDEGTLFSFFEDYIVNGWKAVTEKAINANGIENVGEFAYFAHLAWLAYSKDNSKEFVHSIGALGFSRLMQFVVHLTESLPNQIKEEWTQFRSENVNFAASAASSLALIVSKALATELNRQEPPSPYKANTNKEFRLLFDVLSEIDNFVSGQKTASAAMVVNAFLSRREVLNFYFDSYNIFQTLTCTNEDDQGSLEKMMESLKMAKKKHIADHCAVNCHLLQELATLVTKTEIKEIKEIIVTQGLPSKIGNLLEVDNLIDSSFFIHHFLADFDNLSDKSVYKTDFVLNSNFLDDLVELDELVNLGKIVLVLYSFCRERPDKKERFLNRLALLGRDRESLSIAYRLLPSSVCFDSIVNNINEAVLDSIYQLTDLIARRFGHQDETLEMIDKLFANLESNTAEARQKISYLDFCGRLAERLIRDKTCDMKLATKVKEKVLFPRVATCFNWFKSNLKECYEEGIALEFLETATRICKVLGYKLDLDEETQLLYKILNLESIGEILEKTKEKETFKKTMINLKSPELCLKTFKYLIKELELNEKHTFFAIMSEMMIGLWDKTNNTENMLGNVLHFELVKTIGFNESIKEISKEEKTDYLRKLKSVFN